MENDTKHFVSAIKGGDYTSAKEIMNNILSQKTLDAIEAHKEIVGQQMLQQTKIEDEQRVELDNEEEVTSQE